MQRGHLIENDQGSAGTEVDESSHFQSKFGPFRNLHARLVVHCFVTNCDSSVNVRAHDGDPSGRWVAMAEVKRQGQPYDVRRAWATVVEQSGGGCMLSVGRFAPDGEGSAE
jgi:hypothetical protein